MCSSLMGVCAGHAPPAGQHHRCTASHLCLLRWSGCGLAEGCGQAGPADAGAPCSLAIMQMPHAAPCGYIVGGFHMSAGSGIGIGSYK